MDGHFDDLRVDGYDPLIPPQILQLEFPLSRASQATVTAGRKACVDVLEGRDDRLIVVVGPCSIHDPLAAIEYAEKLKALTKEVEGELVVIMRSYFEKPRTIKGWYVLIVFSNRLPICM